MKDYTFNPAGRPIGATFPESGKQITSPDDESLQSTEETARNIDQLQCAREHLNSVNEVLFFGKDVGNRGDYAVTGFTNQSLNFVEQSDYIPLISQLSDMNTKDNVRIKVQNRHVHASWLLGGNARKDTVSTQSAVLLTHKRSGNNLLVSIYYTPYINGDPNGRNQNNLSLMMASFPIQNGIDFIADSTLNPSVPVLFVSLFPHLRPAVRLQYPKVAVIAKVGGWDSITPVNSVISVDKNKCIGIQGKYVEISSVPDKANVTRTIQSKERLVELGIAV
jgi:hypothetical protein